MITVQSITHRYRRDTAALRDITLTFGSGITGLMGVNGAGKTTLLNIVSGGLKPTSGSVSVDNLHLYASRERTAALAKVALMPQAGHFPRGLTCGQFVSYLTWMRGCHRKEASRRAKEALAKVKLAKRIDTKMGALSGGMVRRVWLAQALAAPGDVLLLDEPSTGLDPRQRAVMVDLLHAETKPCVILSSHILEDVTELAQRVVVLDEGRLVFDGPVTKNMDAHWFRSVTAEIED